MRDEANVRSSRLGVALTLVQFATVRNYAEPFAGGFPGTERDATLPLQQAHPDGGKGRKDSGACDAGGRPRWWISATQRCRRVSPPSPDGLDRLIKKDKISETDKMTALARVLGSRRPGRHPHQAARCAIPSCPASPYV